MGFFRTLKSNIDSNSFYISKYDSYEKESIPSWRKIGKQFGNKYRKIEVNVLYSWIDKGYGFNDEIEELKKTYIKDKYIQASQLQIEPKNTVAGILESLCDIYIDQGYLLYTEENKNEAIEKPYLIPSHITDMEDWEKRFRDKNKPPDTDKHILKMLIMFKYREDILLRPVFFSLLSEVLLALEDYNDSYRIINSAINSIYHRDSLAYPVLHRCISHKIKVKEKLHIRTNSFEETLLSSLNEIKSKYGANAYPDRIMDLSVDSIIKKILI